ncbi:MAG TPA: glycosyltransferase [Bryobacteraceae bacterium]|nr:glycosyltransferase [Bryobacteraceae bacterium]
MAKIALVCPPLPGHLNPMLSLGRALQRRGHAVTFFHIPAIEGSIRSQGIEFAPIGTVQSDTLAEMIRQMAMMDGLGSLRFAVRCSCQIAELLCEQLPAALEKAQIDLMLADQNEPAAATVAEHLGLPFINVCPSLPVNREPGIPPPFVDWPYLASKWGHARNRIGYALSDLLISPINRTINRYRRGWGMPPISRPDDTFSRLAQLCQLVRELDFPRREAPESFHYLGPFYDASSPAVAFPFEQLNGKPLIYATLGTLQARNSRHFSTIAEACTGLDAQLVIATGGQSGDLPRNLPGGPVLVRYAPQLEILARASLTITHAGLNTVMQSLLFGVPMIALPITHDQPAIAARVAASGAGEVIPMKKLRAAALRESVQRVSRAANYRTRARELSESIRRAGGVERAATIVEDVLAGSAAKPA